MNGYMICHTFKLLIISHLRAKCSLFYIYSSLKINFLASSTTSATVSMASSSYNSCLRRNFSLSCCNKANASLHSLPSVSPNLRVEQEFQPPFNLWLQELIPVEQQDLKKENIRMIESSQMGCRDI